MSVVGARYQDRDTNQPTSRIITRKQYPEPTILKRPQMLSLDPGVGRGPDSNDESLAVAGWEGFFPPVQFSSVQSNFLVY